MFYVINKRNAIINFHRKSGLKRRRMHRHTHCIEMGIFFFILLYFCNNNWRLRAKKKRNRREEIVHFPNVCPVVRLYWNLFSFFQSSQLCTNLFELRNWVWASIEFRCIELLFYYEALLLLREFCIHEVCVCFWRSQAIGKHFKIIKTNINF